MRVLHVVPSYLPAMRYGGPIRSVHGLCKALARQGHEVHVFTTNVDGPDDSEVPLGQPVEREGVKVWYFPSRRLRRLYRAPEMMRALRREMKNFDIVHLHSVFLWPTWAAARAARRAGVPYLLAPRGMLVQDLIRHKSRFLKSAWIRLVERRNLERAAAVHITTSLEAAELARFGFRLQRVVEVPNGIDFDAEPIRGDDADVLTGRPYVLFLSRVNWKKNLDPLIRSWSAVQGADLVVAGNDEENYQPGMERLARELGLAGRVRFIGPVDDARKWALYRHAKAFVLPSRSENFGIVVLEAMSVGCPVVISPGVGLADAVAESGCGLVAEAEPVALAQAINGLLADGELRAAMGALGRQTARERFGWPAIAERMAAAYRGIIGNVV
jgi:glycosyltransferase involved in cell wall biosynthesis